ncbi:MAG: hypothetical protein QM572_03845 [Nocardioides sp.]|uniref:hypothetical protein n=1 Tax=Nocardioides sp. TaxID=35761 RepID=UPI0039E3CF2E
MRPLLLVFVSLLATVIAGCGDGEPTPSTSASVSDSASTSPTLTATPSLVVPSKTPATPDRSALADEAEAAAGRLATSTAAAGQGIVEGGDVSWPQCPKGMGIPEKRSQGSPMPLDSATFVILGLTNGPGFTPNPCLASQVAWARDRRLLTAAYSVVSWPSAAQLRQYGASGPFDSTTRDGRLANAGYAQALFNIDTMKAAGLSSPAIWLDVEPVPHFDWPANTDENAQVVRGAARAYADQGYQTGVYSTTALWARVVGDLRLGLREWRAAGNTSRAEALIRCGQERTIQGGTPVLTQWVQSGRDRDVTCPGESANLSRWFHQF